MNIMFLTIVLGCDEEAPKTLWTKTFERSGWDFGNSVHQTSDGGYIITGQTTPYGERGSDVWLIKTDASGDSLWTKIFKNGSSNDVQQTADGGYIITGESYSNNRMTSDILLIKTNASGELLWTRTFGRSDIEFGNDVQQTSDGGYIIIGMITPFGAGISDVWLIKTDASGDSLWTKTFANGSSNSIEQTSDGGYIFTGSTRYRGATSGDAWLIKTNESGDVIWEQTLGGSDIETGNDVEQTSDGGYIIVGSSQSFGADDSDVLLIKVASNY